MPVSYTHLDVYKRQPIYQTENQYSKGVKVEFVYNYPRAKGKYIASVSYTHLTTVSKNGISG